MTETWTKMTIHNAFFNQVCIALMNVSTSTEHKKLCSGVKVYVIEMLQYFIFLYLLCQVQACNGNQIHFLSS